MVVFIAQGTIARQPGSGRRTIITDEIRKIVEEQMCRDNSHVLTSMGLFTKPEDYSSMLDIAGVDV